MSSSATPSSPKLSKKQEESIIRLVGAAFVLVLALLGFWLWNPFGLLPSATSGVNCTIAASKWSESRVGEWARGVPGVPSEMGTQFQTHRIDGPLLLRTTDADLAAIVPLVGPRMRLADALRIVRSTQECDEGPLSFLFYISAFGLIAGVTFAVTLVLKKMGIKL